MVEDKNNIENLFQTSFDNYRAQPSQRVWNGIEAQMGSNRSSYFKGGLSIVLVGVIAITLASLWDNTLPYVTELVFQEGVAEIPNKSENTELSLSVKDINVKETREQSKKTLTLISKKQEETEELKKDMFDKPSQTKLDEPLTAKNVKELSAKKADSNTYNISKLEKAFEISSNKGCKPFRISAKSLVEGQGQIVWDFGDGSQQQTKDASHTYSEAGTFTVTFSFTHNGSTYKYYDQIVVHDTPIAICELSVNDVSESSPVFFYNYSEQAVRYEWSVGNKIISQEREPMMERGQLAGKAVKLKVWSENNCADDTVIPNPIQLKNEFYIEFPNAFTPDQAGPGSGYYQEKDINNTVFRPLHRGVAEYRLQIYNRWGNPVFQTEDVNIGWDGYFNGRIAKEDVYIWTAVGTYSNGKSFDRRGNVTLLKK